MLPILLLAAVFGAGAPDFSQHTSSDQWAIDKAWTVLRDGLDNKSADHRTRAVHALGLLKGNHKGEEWAEKALTDTNADVRAQAAGALAEMGADAARPKLRAALNDPDVKVVVAAANALYVLKDPAAYEVYYALLTGERKSSAGLVQSQLDLLRNRKQLEMLVFQTGIGFVPYGSVGYEAWKRVTEDASSPVRAAAAEKLATDPDPKSGKALVDACSDRKWEVRAASAHALALRGDPKLISAVQMLLDDENDTVRSQAAAAVIRLSGPAPSRRSGPHKKMK